MISGSASARVACRGRRFTPRGAGVIHGLRNCTYTGACDVARFAGNAWIEAMPEARCRKNPQRSARADSRKRLRSGNRLTPRCRDGAGGELPLMSEVQDRAGDGVGHTRASLLIVTCAPSSWSVTSSMGGSGAARRRKSPSLRRTA